MMQQRIADVSAAAVAATAGTTWIVEVNDVLQLVATAIAIVVGIMTFAFHYEGWKARRRANRKDKT